MSAARCSVAALNALDAEAFTALLGGVFEHSPWIARAAFGARPFGSIGELHAAMLRVVVAASVDKQLRLLRAHPMLASSGMVALTAASAAEQAGTGLDRLTADEGAVLDALNRAYRARFGFPFIIAVRGQRGRDAILAALQSRVRNAPEQERATALAEVAKIARYRLYDLVAENGDAG
ncbi:MAG TPA: 2-oxo-4-hydroxy-4-carboxy-5-ureidoimidazoline decarboxylase [Acetobacteraceae bacterium]|nr:2-oxo-4-hydroxy-4-carboxy-5-ureidoimidazoline decarboxylase [Acetobacteraceae bacterium]